MEDLPYRVIKDDKVISTHKYSGQAIDACKAASGNHVYYVNQRNYGAVVWSADWQAAYKPAPPKPDGGYL